MSKFKPGDRVVIISHALHKKGRNGMVFEVVRFSSQHTDDKPKYVLNDTSPYYYHEQELEHEFVFNSPLYKALT